MEWNGIRTHPTFRSPKRDRIRFTSSTHLIETLYSRAGTFPQELFGHKDIEIHKGLFRVAEFQISTKVLIKSYGLSSTYSNCKRLSLRELSRLWVVFLKLSNKRKYNPTSSLYDSFYELFDILFAIRLF